MSESIHPVGETMVTAEGNLLVSAYGQSAPCEDLGNELNVENSAVPIWMLRTSLPGYIVYEDEFQVVAEPFIDLKRRI